MLELKNYNDPLDHEELCNLLDLHEETKVDLSLKIRSKLLKDNGMGIPILLWLDGYHKKPDFELERKLVDEGDKYILIGYLKLFPDLSSGPIWELLGEDAELAVRYAEICLGGRFPRGEKAILISPYKEEYMDLLKKFGSKHELLD